MMPIGQSGMNQQPRRIDLHVFALHAERLAVFADAEARPLAAHTQIGTPLGNGVKIF
jgi:hypothetical protein